jgi:PE family
MGLTVSVQHPAPVWEGTEPMTHVFTQPQAMATAAADLAGIGSTIREANAAAAGSTTSVVAAAQDEVSAAISALFGSYGQEYQALTAQTALFHDQFVQALTSGGGAYNNAEAASATAMGSYDPIDGFDLVVQQRELQLALQSEMQAIYEVERQTDMAAEADAEAAIQQALATWAEVADLRTKMLKSVSDVLKDIGRG